MKSSHRYVTLLATASLALAGTTLAQSSSGARTPDSATAAGSRANDSSMGSATRSSDATMGAISRVTKDSVKNRFTAKDLIGAGVYDPAGEKIGDIADVDLQGNVPGSLASTYNQDQSGDRSMARTTNPATPTSSGNSAVDALGDSTRAIAGAAASSLGQPSVLVSVGGLWGIGDDLVSVPMSKLTYNSDKDHFVLSGNKADIVALAEGNRSAGYAASDTRNDTMDSNSSTAAGKQSFAAEATRVQASLKSDPQTSAFAQNITVTSDGENLELHGLVDNKEQQKRLVEAARRATRLKINDETEIRE